MALSAGGTAFAQKRGGVLNIYHRDSPASMSIHEEATISTVTPKAAVFNNLVVYDQHVAQNSLRSIVPELATGWLWLEDGTELTFRLREGVKWHDGQPFTAKDVLCTWDMLIGKAKETSRQSPQFLVQKPRSGHRQWRLRGGFPSEATATGVYRAAGFGVFASLSLSRLAPRQTCPAGRSEPGPSSTSRSLQVGRASSPGTRTTGNQVSRMWTSSC